MIYVFLTDTPIILINAKYMIQWTYIMGDLTYTEESEAIALKN